MELSTMQRDGILILRLDSKELDAKQAQGFKEKAIQIINQKGNDQVIFDLQKLQFIDSSGLGAFLSLLRQINTRGGRLCLAGMTPAVKTIFELVSMQKIFECCGTTDEAIHHLTDARK
jgi:anti-anti-sigma factor